MSPEVLGLHIYNSVNTYNYDNTFLQTTIEKCVDKLFQKFVQNINH